MLTAWGRLLPEVARRLLRPIMRKGQVVTNEWNVRGRPELSPEVRRAFGYACGSAARRALTEIGIEDLLVGLRHAVGKRILSSFETPDAVEKLVAQIVPEGVNLLEVFNLPASLKNLSVEKCSIGYSAGFFKQSTGLQAVLEAAESIARSRSDLQITVDDMIQALAKTECTRQLLEKYGIHFRSDLR